MKEQNKLTLALREAVEEFENEVVESLEKNFPKLNRETPEIPSANNRKDALVLQADARIAGRKLHTRLLTAFEEMVEELPQGHTPDGKNHWVDAEDIDQLLSLLHEAKKETE